MRDKNNERSNITNVTERELELLERHLEILMTVKEQGPIGIIRLSSIIRQPQHMIRYSLRALEKGGLIAPSTHGAIKTDRVKESLDAINTSLDNISDTVMNLKKKICD